MRTTWILPLALHSILAFANPAAEAEDDVAPPVYGDIKLTYATPAASSISLNLEGLEVRDATAYGDVPLTFATPTGTSSVSLNVGTDATGSCLTKPSNIHTKSRTRARSHIRTCGESGGTCVPSSTAASSKLATPSSAASSGFFDKLPSASPSVSPKVSSKKHHAHSEKGHSASVSTVTDYTTTVITTIYETYCPGTSTVTQSGSTYPVEYPSSSKVTETYTTVYPVTSKVTISTTPSSVAAVESSKSVPVTYQTESTSYETKTVLKTTVVPCSGTKTITSDSTTKTSVYPSSSVITQTETTQISHVITLTVTSTPVVPSSQAVLSSESSSKAIPSSMAIPSSETVPSSYVPVTYTSESTYYVTSTVVKTVTVPCSGTSTVTSESSVYTTTYPSSSVTTTTETTKVPVTTTITVTSSSAAVLSTLAVPSSAPASAYKITVVTTVYTTTCPGTTTITSYGTTITQTYASSTVVTETITKTYPATEAESTSKAAHHSHSHKGHATGSLSSYEVKAPSSSGALGSSKSKSHHSHSHHGHSTGSLSSINVDTPTSSAVSASVPTKSASSGFVSSKKPSSSAAVSSQASASSVSSKPSSASASISSKPSASASVSSSPSASVSSKPSASASVSSKASASASVSSKASSAVPSKSASKSSSSSACSTPTQEPKCVPCEGQPGSDPKKWCGLTINDNSYKVTPKTCRTVTYDWDITNTTVAPDGIERLGLLINGQMPGPTIEANWGDTIIVHVHNKMQNNGTSIHFHGARQNYTNEMDGATSITQCPIAPGESYTYKFIASNYGHSWYHSHFALQTYNGVFGPMIVHGPHSAEYDVDAGVLSLQDWSHDTVDMQFDAAQTVGTFPAHGPRTMDLGLINGANVYQNSGERYVLETEFEQGKSYLLRIVNVANQATFKFYIDGHVLQVIAVDYVPIKPYTTNIVNINPGQRYEVVVKADQKPGSYWIRSDSQDACSSMTYGKDVKAIVNYKGFDATPTSTAYTYTDECVDEPYASLIPIVPIAAGAQDDTVSETVIIGPGPQTPNLYKWTLDGSTFVSRWSDPTLWDLSENGTISDYPGSLQLEYPKLGEWVYMIIQSPIPLPHPIHFHGHDFLVVGSGLGFYTGQPLNTKAPPRRDTALMPATATSGGYLVIAWETDNPGAWLMHCHIGFHQAMGFTLEIIEGALPDIKDTITNSCKLDQTCKSWNKYASANGISDTGI